MTDNTKTFKHGEKKQTAIRIIEENPTGDFFEVANLISIALDINKYSARSYYKYMVKNGWVSNVPADATPWKTSKAAKAPKAKAVAAVHAAAKSTFAKKVKPTAVPASAPGEVITMEKPATSMIREFVRKQKAARQA